MIAYQRGMGEHRRLAEEVNAAISSFENLMTEQTPDSTDALAKARVSLVQAVNAYIAHLGFQVSSAANEDRLLPWKEAHCHVIELRRRYSEHIGRFSASTIKTDWPTYRASSLHLMTAMRDHLHQVAAFAPIHR